MKNFGKEEFCTLKNKRSELER